MATMTRDRAAILAELEAAAADVDAADVRLRVAEAYEAVTAAPGLWYRPVDAAATVYVVGCNGAAIGMAWPCGAPFGRWRSALFGPASVATERLGPFRTGRAAAAAIATAAGVRPEHPQA